MNRTDERIKESGDKTGIENELMKERGGQLAPPGDVRNETGYQFRLPSPRQYAFLGTVGAVSFVVAFGLGSILNISTGIPLIGGLLNGVLVSLLLTLGFRTIERFLAATVLWAIFGLLAIPTVTMGPPGTYKIIPALAAGLVWDIFVAIAKGRRWGYLVGGFVGAVVIMVGVFIAAVMLGLPSADRLRSALAFLIPVNGALAVIGIWLGLKVWERRLSQAALFRSFGSQ